MFKYTLQHRKRNMSYIKSKEYTTASVGLFFSFLVHTKRTFFKSIRGMFLFRAHNIVAGGNYVKKFIKLRGMMFSFNIKMPQKPLNYFFNKSYNFTKQREYFKLQLFNVKRIKSMFLINGYLKDRLFFKNIKNISNVLTNVKFDLRSFIAYYFRFLNINSVISSHLSLNMFTINNIVYKNWSEFYLSTGDIIKFFFSQRLIKRFFMVQVKKVKSLYINHTINKPYMSKNPINEVKESFFVDGYSYIGTPLNHKQMELYEIRSSDNTNLDKSKNTSFLDMQEDYLDDTSTTKNKVNYAKLFFGETEYSILKKNRKIRLYANRDNYYRSQLYKYGYFSMKDMEINNLNFSAVKIYKANFYKRTFFLKQFISIFSWRLYEWDRR